MFRVDSDFFATDESLGSAAGFETAAARSLGFERAKDCPYIRAGAVSEKSEYEPCSFPEYSNSGKGVFCEPGICILSFPVGCLDSSGGSGELEQNRSCSESSCSTLLRRTSPIFWYPSLFSIGLPRASSSSSSSILASFLISSTHSRASFSSLACM